MYISVQHYFHQVPLHDYHVIVTGEYQWASVYRFLMTTAVVD